MSGNVCFVRYVSKESPHPPLLFHPLEGISEREGLLPPNGPLLCMMRYASLIKSEKHLRGWAQTQDLTPLHSLNRASQPFGLRGRVCAVSCVWALTLALETRPPEPRSAWARGRRGTRGHLESRLWPVNRPSLEGDLGGSRPCAGLSREGDCASGCLRSLPLP